MTIIVDTLGGPEGLLNKTISPLPEGFGAADYTGLWDDPKTIFAFVPYGKQVELVQSGQNTPVLSPLIFVDMLRSEGWRIVGCVKPSPSAPVFSHVVTAMNREMYLDTDKPVTYANAIPTFDWSLQWLPRKEKLDGLVEVSSKAGRVQAFAGGPLVIEAYRTTANGMMYEVAWCSVHDGYIWISSGWENVFGTTHPLLADLNGWHVRYFA